MKYLIASALFFLAVFPVGAQTEPAKAQTESVSVVRARAHEEIARRDATIDALQGKLAAQVKQIVWLQEQVRDLCAKAQANPTADALPNSSAWKYSTPVQILSPSQYSASAQYSPPVQYSAPAQHATPPHYSGRFEITQSDSLGRMRRTFSAPANPNGRGGFEFSPQAQGDYARTIGSANDPSLSTGWTSGHGSRTQHVQDYYRHTKSGRVIHVHSYYRRPH